MIDAAAILFSTLLVVFVVFRAYVANKTEVWFKGPASPAPPAPRTPSDLTGRAPVAAGASRAGRKPLRGGKG